MGNIILCHNVRATAPYEITRIHHKIYTFEELCYYLGKNIYLVDSTIMNEQLCVWLSEELKLDELSSEIINSLHTKCSIETFILTILRSSDMYSDMQLNKLQEELRKLNYLEEVEIVKKKADNLLVNGEVELAILFYTSILRKEHNNKVDEMFYGKIYACLGACYGRQFLYQEAMTMYDKAFQINNDPMFVKCYLYAAKKHLDTTEYKLLIAKSEVYEELDDILQRESNSVEEVLQVKPSKQLLEEWKELYRQGNK